MDAQTLFDSVPAEAGRLHERLRSQHDLIEKYVFGQNVAVIKGGTKQFLSCVEKRAVLHLRVLEVQEVTLHADRHLCFAKRISAESKKMIS